MLIQICVFHLHNLLPVSEISFGLLFPDISALYLLNTNYKLIICCFLGIQEWAQRLQLASVVDGALLKFDAKFSVSTNSEGLGKFSVKF